MKRRTTPLKMQDPLILNVMSLWQGPLSSIYSVTSNIEDEEGSSNMYSDYISNSVADSHDSPGSLSW